MLCRRLNNLHDTPLRLCESITVIVEDRVLLRRGVEALDDAIVPHFATVLDPHLGDAATDDVQGIVSVVLLALRGALCHLLPRGTQHG